VANSFYKSDSSGIDAEDDGVQSFWFTVLNPHKPATKDSDEVCKNPWNGDEAITVSENYFLDNCVVSIRPAHSHDGYNKSRDAYKMEYFLEISNNDESVRYSSRRLYNWDTIISLAALFRNISFTAAQRVWIAKKL